MVPDRRPSRPYPPAAPLEAEPRPQNDSDLGLIRVGRVAGAHGLGGALKLRPDNPESDSFAHAARVTLELGADRREYDLVSASRAGAGMIRLVLKDLDDANRAEALKGATVMIAAAELPTAAPGEFYHYQAVGCEVVLTDGRRLGAVAEVLSTGANDVLVVRDGNKETLVPVIADVVKAMDLEARRIVVEPVPGLLD